MRETEHFLKMDVRHYFDSVPHDPLKARFRQLFKDPYALALLDRIVDSFETERGRGLPIGTLTSQYFANFYLDTLDRHVKDRLRCRRYLRYMDDTALWHDSATRLADWRDDIAAYVRMELGLEIKSGSRLAGTDRHMPFLGFHVLRGRLLLGRRARRRFRGNLRRYEIGWENGLLDDRDLQRRLDAMLAFVCRAESMQWRRKILRIQDVGITCHAVGSAERVTPDLLGAWMVGTTQ